MVPATVLCFVFWIASVVESSTYVTTKLLPPTGDGHEDDNFGYGVGIAGNYALVGARGYGKLTNAAGSAGPGATFAFKLNTMTNIWESTTQSRFAPSDNEYGDSFGQSIAMYGDYAAISAPYDDVGFISKKYGHGSVYIYKRSNDNWTQTDNVTPNTLSVLNFFYFGSKVVLKNNYLMVKTHRGKSVYLFKKSSSSSNWNEMAVLTPDSSIPEGGWSDTIAEIAMDETANYGFIGYTDDTNKVGKVWAYKRNTNETWTKINTLTSPNSGTNHYFGSSIGMYGNYLAISEHGANKVHIYEMNRSTNEIQLSQTLTGDTIIKFTTRLAIYGDYLCIKGSDTDKVYVYVYVYKRNAANNQWTQINILLILDVANALYGLKLDINGNNLILADYSNNVNGDYSGSAYVYYLTAGPSPTSHPTQSTTAGSSTSAGSTTTAGPLDINFGTLIAFLFYFMG